MNTTTEISDIDTDKPAAKPAKAAKGAPAAAEGRRMVTIHPGSESDGMSAVKLGVNGVISQVPRNIPCALSEEQIEALRNAVYTEWREVDGHFVQHDRQRFSFSITG